MARTLSGPHAPRVSSQARTKRTDRLPRRLSHQCHVTWIRRKLREPRRQLAFKMCASCSMASNRSHDWSTRRSTRWVWIAGGCEARRAGARTRQNPLFDLDHPLLVEPQVVAVGHRDPDLDRGRAERHKIPEERTARRCASGSRHFRRPPPRGALRRSRATVGICAREGLGDVAREQSSRRFAEAIRDRQGRLAAAAPARSSPTISRQTPRTRSTAISTAATGHAAA